MDSTPSTWLTAAFVLGTATLVFLGFGLQKNLALAKSSGFRYVVLPTNLTSVPWLIAGSIFLPLLDLLPENRRAQCMPYASPYPCHFHTLLLPDSPSSSLYPSAALLLTRKQFTPPRSYMALGPPTVCHHRRRHTRSCFAHAKYPLYLRSEAYHPATARSSFRQAHGSAGPAQHLRADFDWHRWTPK